MNFTFKNVKIEVLATLPSYMTINADLRACVKGEEIISNEYIYIYIYIYIRCVVCTSGFYQYKYPEIGVKCSECLKELYCAGGNITWPRVGYWRNSATTTFIPKCFQEEACLYTIIIIIIYIYIYIEKVMNITYQGSV